MLLIFLVKMFQESQQGKNLMIYYSCTKLQNKILIKRKQSLPFLVQTEVIYNQVTPMLLPQQL
ncbi:Uncharacterised protein [Escherichia coli]|nr:Uncharacterised protein [Escherichia coli]SRZ27527.1 Uncharacterised protein [Escherichia coli]